MYKNRKILLVAPALNEKGKIEQVAEKVPYDIVDKFLVVDDGSTDGTPDLARAHGADVLVHDRRMGVGTAIRDGYQVAADEGFDIVVIIAGNAKDDPREITRLLDPICDDDCDFVMGSRYLPGGSYGGDMPLYRVFATRYVHPWLVRRFCDRPVTESSNGYRAMKVSALQDPRIDLEQAWLKDYQLEMYVLMKFLMLDFRTAEVPVSKIYPSRQLGNTKMVPIIGWWKMLYPIILVGLGIRK
jgi:dolichol-phosphate mannosyltransferase